MVVLPPVAEVVPGVISTFTDFVVFKNLPRGDTPPSYPIPAHLEAAGYPTHPPFVEAKGEKVKKPKVKRFWQGAARG